MKWREMRKVSNQNNISVACRAFTFDIWDEKLYFQLIDKVRSIYFHKQYSGIPATITREQFHYSNSYELLFSSYVNRSSENFWLYVCESFSNETKVKFTLEGKCSVLHVLSFKVNISEWNISIFSSANGWWRWLGVDSLKVQPHFKNFRVYRLLYNGDCFKSTEGQTFFGILAR